LRRGLALIALALVGCGGAAEQGRETARRPAPADEAAQAERNALDSLKAFCTAGGRKRDAVGGIGLLIHHARRDIESGDDEDNLAWREDLGWLAGQLERRECLTAQVPRIDRALRLLPLPELVEPEEIYEPEQDYEMPYP
jgi:hypothetical protein